MRLKTALFLTMAIKAQADSLLRRAFYIMSNEVGEVISTTYRSSYVELRLKDLGASIPCHN
jgi:hypothetical protein